MFWFSYMAALAIAGPNQCHEVNLADIVDVEPPAVLVLGERHGTQPDLSRAGRVVRRLAERAEVTLALEVVDASLQNTLDDFADGLIPSTELPAALDWDERSHFPYEPYRPLITAALWDVDVIAAGPATEAPAKTARFPIPRGYAGQFTRAMGEHAVEKGMEERFVRTQAWRDNRISHLAHQSWDQRGFLVVVTGRSHVEGGLGVAWQLERALQGLPVHSYVLHWGSDPACHPGDQVWRRPLWDEWFEQWGWKQ